MVTIGSSADANAAHAVQVSFADKLYGLKAAAEAFGADHGGKFSVTEEFQLMHKADPDTWTSSTTYSHYRTLTFLPDLAFDLIQQDNALHPTPFITYENQLYCDAKTVNVFIKKGEKKSKIYDGEKWVSMFTVLSSRQKSCELTIFSLVS